MTPRHVASRLLPNALGRNAGHSDAGQIIVVFAAGLIVLLLIGALLVDVGFIWLIHRQEQNAADPGAIAAARYIKAETDPVVRMTKMRQAACFYARENGFFRAATDNDGCVPVNDAAGSTLIVNYPPSVGAGDFAGKLNHVEVAITRPHMTFLARVVGLQVIPVTSNAVAAFDNGDSNNSSLVALDPDDCPAGKISGNANVNVHNVAGATGGYVQVNSNCGGPPSAAANDDMCSNGTGALKVDGTAHLTAPQVNVVGSCIADLSDLTGTLDEKANYISDPLANIPPLDLGVFTAQNCGTGPPTAPTGPQSDGCNFNGSGIVDLSPGIYYGGWRIGNNVEVRLSPGIYVIAGGGVSLQAGGVLVSIGGNPSTIARVLIFSTDNPAYRDACIAGSAGSSARCQGGLDFSANSTLKMRGLNTDPCPPVNAVGCPYRGLLIWQDGDASCGYFSNHDVRCPVTVGGQAELDVAGTIYAPTTQVKLDGGSGTGPITPVAAVQIISNTWDITGGPNLDMPYDPAELYRLPQKGLVH
jgi:putative Flp pilus-assembly TadE/G-like protein